VAGSSPIQLQIEAGAAVPLEGTLWMPADDLGVVLVAHGSGCRHDNPGNRYLAHVLGARGIGALLLNLLTPGEEEIDALTADLRFDVALLAARLTASLDDLATMPRMANLRLGLLGAAAGAAAALIAAARRPRDVRAVVSAGGRPDLAVQFLPRVLAPTRLIVAADDEPVLRHNQEAATRMHVAHDLQLVAGAANLFDDPGTFETVAGLASDWFSAHLSPDRAAPWRSDRSASISGSRSE
jgi:putative phosphoribosyl transferase